MILMGDEVRRTQRGNNNAYCQDNEISWFDWTLVEKHADVHRFVSLLIARRLLRDVEHERQRVSLNQHAPAGEQSLARRQARTSRTGAMIRTAWPSRRELRSEGLHFHLILNAYWEPLDFELPPAGATREVGTGSAGNHDVGLVRRSGRLSKRRRIRLNIATKCRRSELPPSLPFGQDRSKKESLVRFVRITRWGGWNTHSNPSPGARQCGVRRRSIS